MRWAHTPQFEALLRIEDPYSYRDHLTMPKFIVNGNNDQYWSTDSLNLYWDDLKGDKWVMHVPNAGHNLEQHLKNGSKDRTRALNGISAFARSQIAGKSFPKLEWKHTTVGDTLKLSIVSSERPLAARLWSADSDTQDFRVSPWREKPAVIEKVQSTAASNGSPSTVGEERVLGEIAAPKEGCLAFYGELEYELDGIRYQLSTQLRLAGKPLKR